MSAWCGGPSWQPCPMQDARSTNNLTLTPPLLLSACCAAVAFKHRGPSETAHAASQPCQTQRQDGPNQQQQQEQHCQLLEQQREQQQQQQQDAKDNAMQPEALDRGTIIAHLADGCSRGLAAAQRHATVDLGNPQVGLWFCLAWHWTFCCQLTTVSVTNVVKASHLHGARWYKPG